MFLLSRCLVKNKTIITKKFIKLIKAKQTNIPKTGIKIMVGKDAPQKEPIKSAL